MSKITYVELAEKILTEIGRPLAPSEIWNYASAKQLTQELKKQSKTPAHTLYTSVFLDSRDNPDTKFYKAESRPARYFLKSLRATEPAKPSGSAEVEIEPENVKKLKEKDLHAFLTYFAFTRFSAYSKTINHSTSKKKDFGEWVHPDMIGVYFPIHDWDPSVLELSKSLGNLGVKIYSFELKRRLSFANLREAFFQTVSNSTWANESYLVAADVNRDGEFIDELTRLANSFGVGIISIDIDDPDASEVLISARERDFLDWDTINKLVMNGDFKALLSRVRNDLSTNEIRKEFYDKILDRDVLLSGLN